MSMRRTDSENWICDQPGSGKGIDPSGSEMALDLYSKLEWLRKEHPGRSHVLASGTPVTNTMAELYTVMRYMDPDGLERDGLSSFDAWATNVRRVKADLEQNASGSYESWSVSPSSSMYPNL